MKQLFKYLVLVGLLNFSYESVGQYPFPQQNYPQVQYVGIPGAQMDFFAAAQNNSMWCWAASIQMVLNYYGVSISQEQIVARTYGVDPYGRPPDWGGSMQAITANLNNWSVDNFGRGYIVMASLNWGYPAPVVLLQELSQGRPVIISYRTGHTTAHTVVVTAASYTSSPMVPIIQSMVVRDPWPSPQNISTSGRVEYSGSQLASLMQG